MAIGCPLAINPHYTQTPRLLPVPSVSFGDVFSNRPSVDEVGDVVGRPLKHKRNSWRPTLLAKGRLTPLRGCELVVLFRHAIEIPVLAHLSAGLGTKTRVLQRLLVSRPGDTRHKPARLFDATHNASVLRAKYIDPSLAQAARTDDANLRDTILDISDPLRLALSPSRQR